MCPFLASKECVLLLVFLCDENQALSSVKFLQSLFWKKPVFTCTTTLHFGKENVASENGKHEACDGVKLFISEKRSLLGVIFTTVYSKCWANIVQYVAILDFNLSFTERNGCHYKEKLAFSILPTLFWPFPMPYVAFPWSCGEKYRTFFCYPTLTFQ